MVFVMGWAYISDLGNQKLYRILVGRPLVKRSLRRPKRGRNITE
jgi:hypothetical protein